MSDDLRGVIDDRLTHIHTVVVPLARKKNEAERAMVRDLSEANIQRFRDARAAYRESMARYHVLDDRMNALMQEEGEDEEATPSVTP
jgi:hypothetical protein